MIPDCRPLASFCGKPGVILYLRLHLEVFVSACTDGDILYSASDGLLDVLDIALRRLGQLLKAAAGGDIALPAGDILIDGLCLSERVAGGEHVKPLSLMLIGNADGDFVEVGENVKLGERKLGRALNLNAVARRHNVEAADAAGSAGSGAVLSARLAQRVTLRSEKLAGEGAFTDAA